MLKITFLFLLIIPIYISGQKKLEIISEIPVEIDGCSCYFSFSQSEFERKEYFYYNNFAELSYIKLDGHLVELTLSNNPENNKFNYYEYKNDSILMKIWKKKSKKSGDEVFVEIGKYEIYDKNKLILQGNFFGECGC